VDSVDPARVHEASSIPCLLARFSRLLSVARQSGDFIYRATTAIPCLQRIVGGERRRAVEEGFPSSKSRSDSQGSEPYRGFAGYKLDHTLPITN
jgi:hypothetical protein